MNCSAQQTTAMRVRSSIVFLFVLFVFMFYFSSLSVLHAKRTKAEITVTLQNVVCFPLTHRLLGQIDYYHSV